MYMHVLYGAAEPP